MDYKDQMKRLEGHPEMKEIPEKFETEETAAPATGSRISRHMGEEGAAEAYAARGRGGFNGGAILAAFAAVCLAALVFWVSDYHFDRADRGAAKASYTVVAVSDIYPGGTATEIEPAPAASATAATTAAASNATATATTDDAADVVYLFPVNGTKVAENASLNKLAKQAVASNADVTVVAYTDESGNAAYNQKLSRRRAQAIGDYLVAHGVSRSHITVEGRGPTHAFANAAQDRRAEVRI